MQASTQTPSQLPALPNDESEMHSLFQPIVSQTADPVSLKTGQHRIDMVQDPCPEFDAAEPRSVQLDGAVFERLKLEWEQRPKELARCANANLGI